MSNNSNFVTFPNFSTLTTSSGNFTYTNTLIYTTTKRCWITMRLTLHKVSVGGGSAFINTEDGKALLGADFETTNPVQIRVSLPFKAGEKLYVKSNTPDKNGLWTLWVYDMI